MMHYADKRANISDAKGSKIRAERYAMHIESAVRHFDEGDYAAAKEAIRRAKIYAALPDHVRDIETGLMAPNSEHIDSYESTAAKNHPRTGEEEKKS